MGAGDHRISIEVAHCSSQASHRTVRRQCNERRILTNTLLEGFPLLEHYRAIDVRRINLRSTVSAMETGRPDGGSLLCGRGRPARVARAWSSLSLGGILLLMAGPIRQRPVRRPARLCCCCTVVHRSHLLPLPVVHITTDFHSRERADSVVCHPIESFSPRLFGIPFFSHEDLSMTLLF